MSENLRTCKYCNKTFSTKGSLTRHNLVAKYCAKAKLKNDVEEEEKQTRLLRDELMISKGKIEVLEKIANRPQVLQKIVNRPQVVSTVNRTNNVCSLYSLNSGI